MYNTLMSVAARIGLLLLVRLGRARLSRQRFIAEGCSPQHCIYGGVAQPSKRQYHLATLRWIERELKLPSYPSYMLALVSEKYSRLFCCWPEVE